MGTPTNGIEVKYLLTGLSRCAQCGGTLEVRTRQHGRTRAAFYTCSTWRRRGVSVCDNRAWIPMEAADYAVLEALEDTILHSEVVSRAMNRALEALQPTPELEARRAALRGRLTSLDGEMARLTDAIAAGAEVGAVVEALKAREQERAGVRATLEGLDRVEPLDARRRAEVEEGMQRRLHEWRTLLRRNIPQARQIVRKLVVGRLTFIAERRHGRCGYTVTGEGTTQKLISGLIPLAHAVASPAGRHGSGGGAAPIVGLRDAARTSATIESPGPSGIGLRRLVSGSAGIQSGLEASWPTVLQPLSSPPLR